MPLVIYIYIYLCMCIFYLEYIYIQAYRHIYIYIYRLTEGDSALFHANCLDRIGEHTTKLIQLKERNMIISRSSNTIRTVCIYVSREHKRLQYPKQSEGLSEDSLKDNLTK